jgi:hypothetical protein
MVIVMRARFARYDDLEEIMNLYGILVPDDTEAGEDSLKSVWHHKGQ